MTDMKCGSGAACESTCPLMAARMGLLCPSVSELRELARAMGRTVGELVHHVELSASSRT
jgi:hypothetical protein